MAISGRSRRPDTLPPRGTNRTGRRGAAPPVWLRRLPNALTCSRFVFTPLFVWAMLWESLAGSVLALGLFVLAAVTDWIDGWLARRLKLVSPFGIFWDPLADKVLVLAALCAFLWLNVVSVWMVVIILAREFLITSVRIFAQQARGMNLPAMPEGKQKMLSQAVAIIGTLAILVARHAVTAATGQPYDTALRRMGDGGAFLARLMDDLPDVLLLVATALSVYSGARFLWRHRRLLSRT